MLVLAMAGLLLLFIVLVTAYVWSARSKKTAPTSCEEIVTFEGMRAVINKDTSSNAQINHAVDTIIERYSHIDDFSVYGSLLGKLCVHPVTDSKVILRFQRALITANPNFKDSIEKALKLGLEGRK